MLIDKTSAQRPAPMHRESPRIHTDRSLESIPQEYVDVAQGMEVQYINFVLNEMQRGLNDTDLDNTASNYYRSLLDYERSQIMAETDEGIGLKKIILDQIYPQHLRATQTPHKEVINAYRQEAESKGDTHE